MKNKLDQIIRNHAYIIWLIFLMVIAVFATNFYDNNKKNQVEFLKKSLNNIFLHKSIKKITSALKPRFINMDYIVREGDTYENIVNNLEISKIEKKLLLNTISKNKNLKILRVNQKISFKIDKKDSPIILEFKIEIDKKNEIFFTRSIEKDIYFSKIVQKDFDKTITYKETQE